MNYEQREIPKNGVLRLLKQAAPGAYTPESVEKAQDITDDFIRTIAKTSRALAKMRGRKRVTKEDIENARKIILKQSL